MVRFAWLVGRRIVLVLQSLERLIRVIRIFWSFSAPGQRFTLKVGNRNRSITLRIEQRYVILPYSCTTLRRDWCGRSIILTVCGTAQPN